jgi:hypothetical protein
MTAAAPAPGLLPGAGPAPRFPLGWVRRRPGAGSDDVPLLRPERPRGGEVAEPALVLDQARGGRLALGPGEARDHVVERDPPGLRHTVGWGLEGDGRCDSIPEPLTRARS